jgi:hypothetical protein
MQVSGAKAPRGRMQLTVTIDANARVLARGDRADLFFDRDAAMGDTVDWILRRGQPRRQSVRTGAPAPTARRRR